MYADQCGDLEPRLNQPKNFKVTTLFGIFYLTMISHFDTFPKAYVTVALLLSPTFSFQGEATVGDTGCISYFDRDLKIGNIILPKPNHRLGLAYLTGNLMFT